MSRDGNIGNSEVTADKAVLRSNGFEIVDNGRKVVAQGFGDRVIVTRLLPDGRTNDSNIEDTPDEDITYAGISEFFDQRARARAAAVFGNSGGNRIAFIEIFGDCGAVRESDLVIDEDGDTAQGAGTSEVVVALEGYNGVDSEVTPLMSQTAITFVRKGRSAHQ